MRRLFICAPLLVALSACQDDGAAAISSASVECALSGAGSFTAECTMERDESDGEKFVTLRHPDGGFRRFQLGVPGRGIVTADGMEEAQTEQLDGIIEVRVGSDRYRLPIAQ